MDLQQLDVECAAISTAPRISLNGIQTSIACQYSFTAGNAVSSMGLPAVAALGTLSICILVMQNGFTVIGSSAPVSPQNYDADLGARLAYDDCIRQLWPLMGYALGDRIYAAKTI